MTGDPFDPCLARDLPAWPARAARRQHLLSEIERARPDDVSCPRGRAAAVARSASDRRARCDARGRRGRRDCLRGARSSLRKCPEREHPDVVARRAEDRVRDARLRAWDGGLLPDGRLDHERRRDGKGEPHPPVGAGGLANLVSRLAESRLRGQSLLRRARHVRRHDRDLPHECERDRVRKFARGAKYRQISGQFVSEYAAIPTWSPDGRKIAFISDRAGSAEVYVMKPTGAASGG